MGFASWGEGFIPRFFILAGNVRPFGGGVIFLSSRNWYVQQWQNKIECQCSD
jgi:hypothetical protein